MVPDTRVAGPQCEGEDKLSEDCNTGACPQLTPWSENIIRRNICYNNDYNTPGLSGAPAPRPAGVAPAPSGGSASTPTPGRGTRRTTSASSSWSSPRWACRISIFCIGWMVINNIMCRRVTRTSARTGRPGLSGPLVPEAAAAAAGGRWLYSAN